MAIDPALTDSPALPVERRQQDHIGVNNAKWYLISAVGLSVLTMLAFVAIILAQTITGQPLNFTPIYGIAWLIGPIIVALFGGAGINVLQVLDGHQAQLMRAIAEKERAKGVIEGLKENPNTNIS